jgi:ribosomal protein S18 acetylase RimI-like enzyme
VSPRKSLTIRPFADADEADVIALWESVFPNDPPWNDPPQIIRRKKEVQRELFLVGEVDGRVIATVLAGYDGFRGWVYHLAVAKTEQRRGHGRTMMAEVERLLRARGCPKINLQVRAANAEVIEFYKAIGYGVEDHACFGKLLD